jgi:hypothetical protein
MLSLIHPHNQEMFEDIKGVIRRRKSQNDRQYNVQIKRTKGVIRRRKLQNDRKYMSRLKEQKVL